MSKPAIINGPTTESPAKKQRTDTVDTEPQYKEGDRLVTRLKTVTVSESSRTYVPILEVIRASWSDESGEWEYECSVQVKSVELFAMTALESEVKKLDADCSDKVKVEVHGYGATGLIEHVYVDDDNQLSCKVRFKLDMGLKLHRVTQDPRKLETVREHNVYSSTKAGSENSSMAPVRL